MTRPKHGVKLLIFYSKTLSWRTRKTRRRNTWKEKHLKKWAWKKTKLTQS